MFTWDSCCSGFINPSLNPKAFFPLVSFPDSLDQLEDLASWPCCSQRSGRWGLQVEGVRFWPCQGHLLNGGVHSASAGPPTLSLDGHWSSAWEGLQQCQRCVSSHLVAILVYACVFCLFVCLCVCVCVCWFWVLKGSDLGQMHFEPPPIHHNFLYGGGHKVFSKQQKYFLHILFGL